MAGTGSMVSQMGQHQLTHRITEGGWIPGQLAEDPKASQSWFWSALGWGRGTGAGADVLCWLCPNKVGCRAAVVLGLVLPFGGLKARAGLLVDRMGLRVSFSRALGFQGLVP